ncbi:myosin-9-like isoform X1 [Micractinium conductrix]|uniref:Myosin-9-like isoform X1 n=1 Tax=Micractinium conductrix TaxID=554055 RepID=A0A2P6VQP2_9CHLO|nr:myosin-9-like isoform X1 [Micractinium conductrix]|eukprot:PSC76391.1 myosin-9-like isoform X1 [Micractinium conductrix]
MEAHFASSSLPPYWVQQPQQQHQHQHQHQHRQQLELERQNAALAQRCQELQGELEATAAAAAQLSAGLALASPGGSTQTSQKQHPQEQTPQRQQRSATHTLGDGEVDREELALLQRRLAAKQREVEAAAAAVGAKRAQAAQLQAELEEARGLAAALSDELARWKGECAQRERELRTLQQRVEAAEAHAGHLEDGESALKKRNSELGTALAQRKAAVRQLEDRLRALQGSEGSKERQMEVLHSEVEALRREGADLRRHNATLQAEVQRLEPAHGAAGLQEAEQEQWHSPTSGWQPYQQHQQLEAAVSVQAVEHDEPLPLSAVQLNRNAAHAPLVPAGAVARYAKPSVPEYVACNTAGSYPSSPPSCGRSPRATPLASLAPQHAATGGAAFGTPVAASHASRPSGQLPQEHEHQQRPPAPSSHGSPASTSSGACQRDAASFLAAQLGGLGLATPGSSSSPFATEATLQDMLGRTQALEDRLLALNAERNALEAEAARMPSHTNGRTLKERKRRGEVEGRLEAIAKESSSVRLQLRRLGVK